MLIIGCDFHAGFQQVAIFDNRTGEMEQKRLRHRSEAEGFYQGLRGGAVLVGMEACGQYPWFERLLAECGHQLWIGDAARIRAGRCDSLFGGSTSLCHGRSLRPLEKTLAFGMTQ